MRGTGGQHTPCTSHPKHKQTTRGTNNKSSAPKKNTKKKRNNLGYVSHRPGWRRGELDLDLARNLALAGSDAQDVADGREPTSLGRRCAVLCEPRSRPARARRVDAHERVVRAELRDPDGAIGRCANRGAGGMVPPWAEGPGDFELLARCFRLAVDDKQRVAGVLRGVAFAVVPVEEPKL